MNFFQCDTYGKGLWETEPEESVEWNKKMERELVHSAYFIMPKCPPEAAILCLPIRADIHRKSRDLFRGEKSLKINLSVKMP